MQSSVNAKQHRSQSSQIHTAIVSPSKIIFTVCFTTLLILPLIPGFRLQHHKLVSFMTFRGLYFWQRTSQLFLCRKSKKCVQSKIVSDTIFFVINKRANLIYFNRKYKFNMRDQRKRRNFRIEIERLAHPITKWCPRQKSAFSRSSPVPVGTFCIGHPV